MLPCADRIRVLPRWTTRRSCCQGIASVGGIDGSARVFRTGGQGLERGVANGFARVPDPGTEGNLDRRGRGAGALWPFRVEPPDGDEVWEDPRPLAQPGTYPRGNTPGACFRQGKRDTRTKTAPAGPMVLGDGDHNRGGGRGLGRHPRGDAFRRARILTEIMLEVSTLPMSVDSAI